MGKVVDRQPFYKSTGFLFALYWTLLVAWQNISGAVARTSFDLIIKIVLLIWFVLFYVQRYKRLSPKIFIALLLGAAMLITAIRKDTFSLSVFISYLYPLLFMAMVYGIGDHFTITKSQLLSFCNWIILVTLYAAGYAMIFCWDQFAGALFLSQSYGNELSSFFVSNHEYGLYLLAAIVSCLLCLRLTENLPTWKTALYVVAIGILGVNLILTFSRTALLAFVLFLVIFAIFGKGAMRRWILCLSIITAAIIFLTPQLREWVFKIVMKENNSAGRDVLYEYGLNYYRNSSLTDKILGHGIEEISKLVKEDLLHGSFHNAYIQILLNYGIVGFSSLLLFLVSQVIAAIKFIKKDRFLGAVALGLVIAASAMMFTNTAIIFTSPIDSFFLTIFMFIVPKYVRNAVELGVFNKKKTINTSKE